jgi:hypothetical protein
MVLDSMRQLASRPSAPQFWPVEGTETVVVWARHVPAKAMKKMMSAFEVFSMSRNERIEAAALVFSRPVSNRT